MAGRPAAHASVIHRMRCLGMPVHQSIEDKPFAAFIVHHNMCCLPYTHMHIVYCILHVCLLPWRQDASSVWPACLHPSTSTGGAGSTHPGCQVVRNIAQQSRAEQSGSPKDLGLTELWSWIYSLLDLLLFKEHAMVSSATEKAY